MELSEHIKTINDGLESLYGKDFNLCIPFFRVVWSGDQYEKRLMPTSLEGFELITPIVMEVPKYGKWIKDRYILEQLVVVPEAQVIELAGVRISYEPLWIFETQLGVYLPPRMDAAKLIVDTMLAARGKTSLRKYVDEEAANPIEAREKRIRKLEEELFGNETAVGDALAYESGVGYGPKKGIQ